MRGPGEDVRKVRSEGEGEVVGRYPARKTLLNVGRLTAILTEKVLKSTEISVIQNFVSISV